MQRLSSLLYRDDRRRNLGAHAIAKAPPFVYVPLQHIDEIRLLNIPPRCGIAEGIEPNFSIHHACLSTEPLYAAVSYTWSHSRNMVDIQIDGQKLTIQTNLKRILEHLRDDNQSRRVWIDAICIDQTTMDERNHQVQLMGQIYHKANYVVACLTAERPNDSRRLQHEARELHKRLKTGASTSTNEYRHFFGNRYFTRRWIIQEINQAQAVTFCCEGYEIPMSLLAHRFKDLSLRPTRVGRDNYSFLSVAEKMAERQAIQLCKNESGSPRNLLKLEKLLYMHETAECRDFRDRIYALLSLTLHAQSHLLVQYNIDRVQLMLSVLSICYTYEGLSAFRTLSFMCFLRQHLQVRMNDLRDGVLSSTNPMIATTFAVQGTVIGQIETLQPGARTQDVALRFRNCLSDLLVYPFISLKTMATHQIASTLLEIDRVGSPSSLFGATATTPGIDQCLFVFSGNESCKKSSVTSPTILDGYPSLPPPYESTRGPLFTGFASVRVDIGDEIWQFDRTHVAVVARRTSKGYDLVGRAFVIKDLIATNLDPRPDRSSRRLEDKVFWIKNGTNHGQPTPTISVDFRGLYELMTWVTFD